MKIAYTFLSVLFLTILFNSAGNAQVPIAGWDISTQTGGTNNFGTSPLSANTTASNTTIGSLIRGSGVSVTGTGAARGWGGVGWNVTTSDLAISGSKFVTFTVKANSGYAVSLTAINPFDYRRSPTGPPSGLLQYSLDGTNFTDITSVSFPTTTSAGDHVGSTNLSGISALQNVSSSTTITFRIVPYNASSSGGTWYIFDVDASTTNDLAITGTVVTGSMDNGRVLSLTALIEGLYNGTSMVPDTVTVELHDASSTALVDQQTGLLSASGTGTFTFRTAVNGSNYYIVVKHRNAIETWSASVLSFTSSALSYNFTTAATQAYGSNMVLKGGKYCFYSGDVNQDNNVNLLDLIAIDNDNTNIATGYQITDLNGDGNVNLLDLIIVDNNNTAIVKRLAPSGTLPPSNVNLTMGNPNGATTDVNYPHNYLLDKPQFCASYDRDKGIPNWTSWQLNSTWLGSATRETVYSSDNTLPPSFYHVTTSDYSNTGFSRGHMCPSADRLNTDANNTALFVMTNMIPQNQANNQGAWEGLENYERTLAIAGNVIYIISGGYGAGGTGLNGYAETIAGGKVTVPKKIWKVMIVLPAGTNDISRVTVSTRTIAMIINNDSTASDQNSWGTYRVSVDSVESLTGYDFFSNVSPSIQAVIEANTDTGPTN